MDGIAACCIRVGAENLIRSVKHIKGNEKIERDRDKEDEGDKDIPCI